MKTANERWFGGRNGERIAVIVAHPDDEVLGLGARLPQLQNGWFFQVTDGAPLDGRDALRCGFKSNEDYARARRGELESALRMAGLRCQQCIYLGVRDQQTTRSLTGLTAQLVERLAELRPSTIVTHPYEGGHPDHDATAFAVHAATSILGRRAGFRPAIVEMTSYHQGPHGIEVGTFLPFEGCPITSFVLSAEEREFKKQLIACFRTQQETLAYFAPEVERFRPAPRYDFTAPPHPGRLFYENYDWGMTGTEFRALARHAAAELELVGA